MIKSIATIPLLSICLLTSCSLFKGKSKSKLPPLNKTEPEKVIKQKNFPHAKLTQHYSNDLENQTVTNSSNKERIIGGFMEPDVTQLPDNKVLQESANVAPVRTSLTPLTPETETPLLTDPTTPLPDNQ